MYYYSEVILEQPAHVQQTPNRLSFLLCIIIFVLTIYYPFQLPIRIIFILFIPLHLRLAMAGDQLYVVLRTCLYNMLF